MCGTATADVQSANAVGYTTQSVGVGKYAAVGVQFEAVGGQAGKITVADFIKGDFEACEYDFPALTFNSKAPNIQVWGGLSYKQYYYLKEHHFMNNPSFPLIPEGWCDMNGQPAGTDTLDYGSGAWFRCPASDCVINVAGQVAVAEEKTFTLEPGKFYMLANFIPTELDIRNTDQVAFEGFSAGEYDFPALTFNSKAPNIQVWGGLSYTQYYLLKEHHFMNNPSFPLIPEGWCDMNGQAITDANTIPVGRGFWIRVPNADAETYTVTFKQ